MTTDRKKDKGKARARLGEDREANGKGHVRQGHMTGKELRTRGRALHGMRGHDMPGGKRQARTRTHTWAMPRTRTGQYHDKTMTGKDMRGKHRTGTTQ